MTRHLFLESFERNALTHTGKPQDDERLEQARSEAYEAGYASGWDDAVTSDKTSKLRVDAEFERNIQNLTLTFSEAVAHVRTELDGFVTALIETLLPTILPDLLREHVRAEILRLGDSMMELSIEIVASSDSRPLIADLLGKDHGRPVELVEDDTLAHGQVHVRLGSHDVVVDLGSVLTALKEQFGALKDTPVAERTPDA